VVALDSVLHPALLSGHSYWLYFSDSFPFGSLWFFNDQGISGIRTTGQEALLPGFRVEVVPEPSAALLLIVGLALLAVLRGTSPRMSATNSCGTSGLSCQRLTTEMESQTVRVVMPNQNAFSV
jgi:hypothetical protein